MASEYQKLRFKTIGPNSSFTFTDKRFLSFYVSGSNAQISNDIGENIPLLAVLTAPHLPSMWQSLTITCGADTFVYVAYID